MNREDATRRCTELRNELDYHSHLYYVEASPEISDQHYDRMFRELQDIEDEFPELRTNNSPTQTVGALGA